MKNSLVLIISMLFATVGYCAESAVERSAKQAELDGICEAARKKALAPMKRDIFQECLTNGKEEEVCQAEADGFNGARVGRGPLFYDLPECEAAFEYQKSQ